jgi:hypothetical protein
LSTPRLEPNSNTLPAVKVSDIGSLSGDNPASRSSRYTWTIILAAGLAAGFVSFAIGEVSPSQVPPALDLPQEIWADHNQVPIETERRMRRSKDLSAAITYGSLGMLLAQPLQPLPTNSRVPSPSHLQRPSGRWRQPARRA